MELSPKKIINEYFQNQIDKLTASKLLLSLIENTDNNKTRIECINQLDNIRVEDDRSFEVLEHLLISDSNALIRNSAAITLYIQDFLGDSTRSRSFIANILLNSAAASKALSSS